MIKWTLQAIFFGTLPGIVILGIQLPRFMLTSIAGGAVHSTDSKGRSSALGYGLGASGEGKNSPDWQFAELSRRSRIPWTSESHRSLRAAPYDPAPMQEDDIAKAYISEVCAVQYSIKEDILIN